VLIGVGFNEPISLEQIGSMGIVLSGVFIINYWSKMKLKLIKEK
jgi:drug/metabolite transporter (DMT)-like permease